MPPHKLFQLDDGWVLYRPEIDRLMMLNDTGKMVWELLNAGYEQDEIASVFAEHFDLSIEQSFADVQEVMAGLNDLVHSVSPSVNNNPASGFVGLSTPIDERDNRSSQAAYCGTFRFGNHSVRLHLHGALTSIGSTFFSRFRHRAIADIEDAPILELINDSYGYRLSFQDELIAEVETLTELLGQISKRLLDWEHPDINFLAYFHAAAVSRDGQSILLPGVSGIGKSTLTAYLVGHGFAYLGDDSIAMAMDDWSLRPLPTQLSLKSGSWPILELLYPELPLLQTVHYYGRDVRYVQVKKTQSAGCAPSLMLFPSYAPDNNTLVRPLTPFHALMRLLDGNMYLDHPATETKLEELIRFVEQTPAYDLSYADLANAKSAIEELLDHAE